MKSLKKHYTKYKGNKMNKLDETKPVLTLDQIDINEEEMINIVNKMIIKHKKLLDYLKDK